MAQWGFVGREAEVRRIRQRLADVGCSGLVVAGAAGVGKTRLAVECLRLAERAGLATTRVTATRSASGLPFGALAPLLPGAPPDGEVGIVDDPADLLRRSVAALVRRGGDSRLCLLVDDAHLLDGASATLVHHLAATNSAFVLATVRTGEPAPDPIVALWKDDLLDRLDLGGLQAEAIEELVTSELGGPVDGATLAQLAVRCHGNVLFLRELVLGALGDRTLRDDGGIWRLVGPLAPSDRLVELVETRLAGLSADERGVLELVSFGEPLALTELTALADPGVVEALERTGLLSSERDGHRLEIHLAHPLYGDVLRSRIPAVQLRLITRSLAEVTETTGARRRGDTLRVASWRLDGGGGRPDLMLAAATTARWRYDFPLAERLARVALDAGAGFDAALLASQLASLQGRGADAERELTALAGQARDDAQRSLVALARMDNHAFFLGRLDEGLRVAEEAREQVTDPVWSDEIAARYAGMIFVTKGPAAGARAVEPLLVRAEGRALVWACLTGAYSLSRVGRLDAALEATHRGHAAHLCLARPLEWYPWFHLYFRGLALIYAGRLEEAEAIAVAEYHHALDDNSAEAQAWFALLRAQLATDRGRFETAARHAREALSLFRQLGRRVFEHLCLLNLALTLAEGGRGDDAREALEALDAMGNLPAMHTGVDLLLARAWAAAAFGDLPRARLLLEEGVTAAEAIGDFLGEAAALHSLARLGHAKEAATRLTTLAGQVDGDMVPARAAHVTALARQDAAGLDGVSSAFEAMGADLLAAEAAADAGVAWRRSGVPRKAAASERRAATILGRCEGARTPAVQAIEARAHLTRGERDAALLAAAGRANKEIAGELCISLRTVENRLQHVYEKLGVTSRGELEEALKAIG